MYRLQHEHTSYHNHGLPVAEMGEIARVSTDAGAEQEKTALQIRREQENILSKLMKGGD